MKTSKIIFGGIVLSICLFFAGCKQPNDPTDPASSDPTSSAPVTYTISYTTDYGTAPASKPVEEGYKLTKADLPFLGKDTTSGKLFVGWGKNAGDEITGNVTITAEWQDEVYLDFVELRDKITDITTKISVIFQEEAYPGSYDDTYDFSSSEDNYYTGYLTSDNKLIVSGRGHKIVFPADSSLAFLNCRAMKSITFNDCITNYCTNMKDMFNGCLNLESLDLSGFNTSNVTNMNGMFYGCSKLVSFDLSGFDTSNVTDMNGMFEGCSAIVSLDLSSFNTSNVTDMNSMFSGCTELATIITSDSFVIGSLTSYDHILNNCPAGVDGQGISFELPNSGGSDPTPNPGPTPSPSPAP